MFHLPAGERSVIVRANFFRRDTMDSAKKQASLFSFFQKTPKSNIGPNGDKPKSESNKQTPMKRESDSSWEVEITFNIHDIVLSTQSPGWITCVGTTDRVPLVASNSLPTSNLCKSNVKFPLNNPIHQPRDKWSEKSRVRRSTTCSS